MQVKRIISLSAAFAALFSSYSSVKAIDPDDYVALISKVTVCKQIEGDININYTDGERQYTIRVTLARISDSNIKGKYSLTEVTNNNLLDDEFDLVTPELEEKASVPEIGNCTFRLIDGSIELKLDSEMLGSEITMLCDYIDSENITGRCYAPVAYNCAGDGVIKNVGDIKLKIRARTPSRCKKQGAAGRRVNLGQVGPGMRQPVFTQ